MSTHSWPKPHLTHAISMIVLAVCFSGCRTRPSTLSDDANSATQHDGSPNVEPKRASAPVRILYPAAPGSFVDLRNEIAPSVVHLRSKTKVRGGPGVLIPGTGESYALGSAFVLNRKGYLVTSEHLIATAPEIEAVLAGGVVYPVQVVGRDSKLDLALLKIDAPAASLKPVRLGDSDMASVGEWVLALGNPQGTEVTASAGIISALGTSDRDAIIKGSKTNYQSFIHTDAKIDVGNSGGPLIDMSGAVIGINSAVAAQGGDMRLIVPINRANQVFPMLETNGRVTRTWLGVYVHPVTMAVAKERNLNVASGALVSEVIPSSPAGRAGILAGDVIMEFDGKSVDHRSLPFLSSTTEIGKRIPVLVWRSGAPRTLTLLSEKMP